jgi:hypothetical protein
MVKMATIRLNFFLIRKFTEGLSNNAIMIENTIGIKMDFPIYKISNAATMPIS